MSDPETTDWVVGCNLTVQTKNEEIQGEVFAYDKGSNTVIVRQRGSTPFHSNLRLLKVSYIKVGYLPELAGRWQQSKFCYVCCVYCCHVRMHVQGVNSVSAPAQPVDPLPLVDMQRCKDRESKALQVRLKDNSNASWQCPVITCENRLPRRKLQRLVLVSAVKHNRFLMHYQRLCHVTGSSKASSY